MTTYILGTIHIIHRILFYFNFNFPTPSTLFIMEKKCKRNTQMRSCVGLWRAANCRHTHSYIAWQGTNQRGGRENAISTNGKYFGALFTVRFWVGRQSLRSNNNFCVCLQHNTKSEREVPDFLIFDPGVL